MPLTFQQIPLTFGQGLDTKTDRFQLAPGKLATLVNGVFNKGGAIELRNGYQQLPNIIRQTGGPITSCEATAVFGQELVLFDGSSLYSYSPTEQEWSLRGEAVGVIPTTHNIVRGLATQYDPDVAYSAGLECYTWTDSRGGVWYSLIDSTTRTALASEVQIDPTGTRSKVISVAGRFVVIWITSGGLLEAARIDPGNPQTPNLQFLPATLAASAPCFDVCVNGQNVIVANSSGTTSAQVTVLSPGLATLAQRTYSLSGQPSMVSVVSYGLGGQSVWLVSALASKLTVWTDSTTLGMPATFDVAISGVTRIGGAYFYGTAPTYAYEQSGVVGLMQNWTGSTIMRGLSLAGKPFSVSNGRVFVPCATSSALQASYVLLRDDGAIASRESATVGGGARSSTGPTLSETPQVSSVSFLCAQGRKGQVQSNAGNLFSSVGVVGTYWDFSDSNSLRSSSLGQQLIITGGVIRSYDGKNINEHGFLLYPEGISSSPSAGGAILDGQYEWSFVYRWTDSQGQIHESAPSVPVVLTLSYSNLGKVVFTVPTLRLTEKSNVQIIAFRTPPASAGDTTFYKFATVANSISVDSVTITDDNSGWSTSNEFLYTTGNVLENMAPPAAGLITTYRGRVFLSASDDPNTLWFSKSVVPGSPVQFNNSLFVQLDARGGDIGALAVLDNQVLIFKDLSAIYSLVGAGPDNTGQNNDYTDPAIVATDVGCSDSGSPVTTPMGVIFQTSKGVYLYDRTAQVSYIGSPVDDYKLQTVTEATIVPGASEVRFSCADFPALVYNYLFGQWSTFSYRSVDAGIWNGAHFYATADGSVFVETPGHYLDGATPVQLTIETGWLSFSGLQGFQRIREAYLLGDYRGPHTVSVALAYNFVPAYSPPTVIDAGATLGNKIYGTQGVYGTNGVYGGSYQLEQFRIRPTVQRCESLKMQIIITPSSDNQGAALSGLSFLAGTKGRHRPLAPAKQWGA